MDLSLQPARPAQQTLMQSNHLVLETVEMVNAFVSDALAQLWAAVLAKNATITSLVRRALQPLTSRPQCWRRVG